MTKGVGLAILISGRGSNMMALTEACEAADFPAHVAVVLSNRPDAAGLDYARAKGIPAEIVDHKSYPGREAFEDALIETLGRYDIGLVCLAGFLRILTPRFVSAYEGRIVNIHPSLLPAYKGVNTHERALADGATETGCTVHYVVAELDSGPAIVQRRVPVLAGDTPETLAARVLKEEHTAYPEAIRIAAAAIKNR